MSRFWWSVWSVVKYLFGLSLLIEVLATVALLFGFLPAFVPVDVVRWVEVLATGVAAIAGTMLYADWQWGWTAEHIGLNRRPGAVVGGLAVGLALGSVAAVLAQVIGSLASGTDLSLAVAAPSAAGLSVLVKGLVTALVVELVFRGAVISRYQADLSQREILLAATLTPLAWMAIQSMLRFGSLPAGVSAGWEVLMTVALALLFIRFDSAWLTMGIRAGMLVGVSLLGGLTSATALQGALVVWGATAAILLALEFFKQQGQPKRVQPNRGRVVRGRTVRGPWGPH